MAVRTFIVMALLTEIVMGSDNTLIRGVVRDDAGKPVSGVDIWSPRYGTTAVTDAAGAFYLDSMRPSAALRPGAGGLTDRPHPSPGSRLFTFNINGGISPELFDCLGRPVQSFADGYFPTVSNHATAGRRALPAGIYPYRYCFNGATAAGIANVIDKKNIAGNNVLYRRTPLQESPPRAAAVRAERTTDSLFIYHPRFSPAAVPLDPGADTITIVLDRRFDSARVKTADYAKLARGECALINNPWGKGNLRTGEYHLSIFASLTATDTGNVMKDFGWNWLWPKTDSSVRAYPVILFGEDPWRTHSSTSRLPLRVDSLRSCIVDFSLETWGDGLYSCAFSFWLSDSARGGTDVTKDEIMIYTDYSGESIRPLPGEHIVAKPTIDGIQYELSAVDSIDNVSGDWTFFCFRRVEHLTEGKFDLMPLLNWLAREQGADSTDYLIGLSLGNECVEGIGSTLIKRFDVAPEKTGD